MPRNLNKLTNKNVFIKGLRDPRVMLAVLRNKPPTAEGAFQKWKISGVLGSVPFLLAILDLKAFITF